MPKLLNGETIGGVGYGGTFYNGLKISQLGQSGSPGWYGKGKIVCQSEKPGPLSQVVNYIIGGSPEVFNPRLSGGTVKAGAAVIASCLERAGAFTEIINDTGRFQIPNTYPLCVDKITGTVLLKTFSTGYDLFLVKRNEHDISSTFKVGPVRNASIIDGLIVYENYAGGLFSPSYPLSYYGPAGEPLLIDCGGTPWLIYHGSQMYAHPYNDRTKGYVVKGYTYYPDCEFDGRLKVCYSLDAGDQSVIVVPFDVHETLPEIVEYKPVIDKPNRPAWLGAITFGKQNIPFPGNCKLQVTADGLVISNKGETIYRFVAGNSENDIESINYLVKESLRRFPNITPLPYWDYELQIRGLIPNSPATLVEAYWKVGESLQQFENRLDDSCRKVKRPLLLPQLYTSNLDNRDDLNSVAKVCARVFNRITTIEGFIAFSAGEGRGTGWEDHLEVHQTWNQLAEGLIRPMIAPISIPKIKIVKDDILQLDLTSPYKNFFKDYTDVTEVPHPDGHNLVAYKLPNGKYFSLTPSGDRNSDSDSPGAYERFNIFGNMAIHDLSKAVVPRFSGGIANLP